MAERAAIVTPRWDSPLLEVDAVHAGYGRLPILQGVTIMVGSGEVVSIIGPNGAGKSTARLIVEQNAAKALSLSDRAYVFDLGRNRFEGPGPALLADPEVKRLYLGG